MRIYKIWILVLMCICFCNGLFSQELFVLTDEKTGMQGVVDVNGNVVIPYKYEHLYQRQWGLKSHFLFVKNSHMGVLDSKGTICVLNIYEDIIIADEENNVIVAEKDGKMGLIDFSGNIKLPFHYDEVLNDELKGSLVTVGKYEKEDIKLGVVSLKEKKEVVPCEYEAILMGTLIYEQNFCNDPLFIENKAQSPLIAVKKKGKIGFVNQQGKMVIPCRYEENASFQNHIAKETFVGDHAEYSIVDNYNAYVFQEGKTTFIKNGKVGLMDETGKEIVPANWSSIRNYPSNEITDGSGTYIHLPKKCTYEYATATMNGKGSVLLDKNGKACTDYYEDIWEDEGFVVYKENGKYGLLNLSTKERVTPAYYDGLYAVNEGYIIYKKDGKCGYLDRSGNDRYSTYDEVSPFKNGYAIVKKKGKFGYVASGYSDPIPCIYEHASPFNEEGLAIVKKDGKRGVINVKGKTIVPFKYDDIKADEKNMCFKVNIGGRWNDGAKYGVIGFDGNEMVAPRYSEERLQIEMAKSKKNHSNVMVAQQTEKEEDSTEDMMPFSEVDTNIPSVASKNNDLYVFIIANEDYPMKKVPFALNDGRVFKEYCVKTLGVPLNHIKLYEDATTGQTISCVEQMKQAAIANSGNVNIIFYYAGHAFPDEATKGAYLLPVDGDSKITATGYSLEKLYQELNSVQCASVLCFIDACFSGATRDDELLLEGRGVAIKAKEAVPEGNIVVFTSATGAETAHQYKEKKHGLFTFYLLKKLQETKGNVTLGELADYVIDNVKRTSFDVNSKIQTPTVIPSAGVQNKWRNIKL